MQKYWNKDPVNIDYSQMDQTIVKRFMGTHPKVVKSWLQKEKGLYKVDANYQLTKKQKKHQIMIKIEKLLGLDLSKKHYKLIK